MILFANKSNLPRCVQSIGPQVPIIMDIMPITLFCSCGSYILQSSLAATQLSTHKSAELKSKGNLQGGYLHTYRKYMINFLEVMVIDDSFLPADLKAWSFSPV